MTADLAAWLLDGPIAEDEAQARRDDNPESPNFGATPGWSPDRRLAECAAKRKIIEAHFAWHVAPYIVCATCTDEPEEDRDEYQALARDGYGRQLWPCATLRTLAQPYAGRPGWRDEWTTT